MYSINYIGKLWHIWHKLCTPWSSSVKYMKTKINLKYYHTISLDLSDGNRSKPGIMINQLRYLCLSNVTSNFNRSLQWKCATNVVNGPLPMNRPDNFTVEIFTCSNAWTSRLFCWASLLDLDSRWFFSSCRNLSLRDTSESSSFSFCTCASLCDLAAVNSPITPGIIYWIFYGAIELLCGFVWFSWIL